jgi:hypothetical protein
VTVSIANANAILADVDPQSFENSILRNSRAFRHIQRITPPDTQGPRWKLKTAGYTATNFAEGANFPATGTLSISDPVLTWGSAVVPFKVIGQVFDQLRPGSPQLVANYLNEHTEDARLAMGAKLDAEILGGTTTNGMVGLQVAIDSTGTYAGLNRATVTSFASYQNGNSGTDRDITSALLQTTWSNFVETNKAFWGPGVEVWIAPTPADTLSLITTGAGVPALRQVVSTDAAFFQQIGFGNMDGVEGFFKGVPVRRIPRQEANTCYFLNLNRIKIEELRPMTMAPFVRPAGADDSFSDITWKGNLRVKNPQSDGAVLEDVE